MSFGEEILAEPVAVPFGRLLVAFELTGYVLAAGAALEVGGWPLLVAVWLVAWWAWERRVGR